MIGRHDVVQSKLRVNLLDTHSGGVLVELLLGNVGVGDDGGGSRGCAVSPSRASLPRRVCGEHIQTVSANRTQGTRRKEHTSVVSALRLSLSLDLDGRQAGSTSSAVVEASPATVVVPASTSILIPSPTPRSSSTTVTVVGAASRRSTVVESAVSRRAVASSTAARRRGRAVRVVAASTVTRALSGLR